MTVPEPNEFRQLDTFPHLCNCTPKLPPQRPHPAPLAFHRVAHPWLFLHCQLLNTLFASLIVLFLPFSVSVVLCLLIYCIFLHVSSRETIPTIFSVGGILIQRIYLFALRLVVSYSLLYSVREVWFVSTCHLRQGNSCVRAPLRLRMTSIHIAFGFVHWRRHHALRESSCVSLAHGSRWLFLLLRHCKAFLLLLIRSLL